MKTVPVAEAKAKLSGLVDEVARRDERVTITKRGRPKAVLMSHDEVEGLEATLEIMSDPEFYAEILRNSRELDAGRGRVYTLDELFGPEEGGRRRARQTTRVPRQDRRRPAKPAAGSKAKGARGARRGAGRA